MAADPKDPGKLALQYWFFYAFNDFNNTHEGDWEMIQLNFDAPDAGAALESAPVEVGYSSHEGAERAAWDDPKLERVFGTHPVVYPAAGSHANKFTAALYLGSSAEAGVGCDDTQGPHRDVRPVVETIPSDPAAADSAFPWIDFQGRWGQLAPAFFNGPTGPNLKTQWTEPIEWSKGWRDRSYAVPTGGLLGTSATDFFCVAVETGSRGLIGLLRNAALDAPPARCALPPRDRRSEAHTLAPRDAVARGQAATVGADPVGLGPDVRVALAPVPPARPAVHPARRGHLPRAGARPRRL